MVSLKNRYDAFIRYLKDNKNALEIKDEDGKQKGKKKSDKNELKKDEIAKEACKKMARCT